MFANMTKMRDHWKMQDFSNSRTAMETQCTWRYVTLLKLNSDFSKVRGYACINGISA